MTSDCKEEYRLGYRGDIEGLRAVAILLVVACHAKVQWLAGGFVGVDVFYVLSGYLITGLLVQEIRTTGELRFATFYGRRLRRLLPALLLMLAVTCILGRLLLAADGQPEQALAASSAALWLSNFHFAFSHMDYFAPGAETNLFLHTWSLGVEEQFYLVWPLLVVLAMGAWDGAKHPPTGSRLKFVFGGVFIIALGLSLYWTWGAPRLAFYMMPSRAWQFALGALAFLLVGTPRVRTGNLKIPDAWIGAAGWVGLAMIVGAALLIDGSVPYPGYWALLPTVGAALVLIAGAGAARTLGVGTLLASRPMQAIGRVSYSWYLWHWPVLLLGAQLLDIQRDWNRTLLVIISLLVAMLSYRLFETPIRHNPKLLAKPRMAVFVSLAIMILAGSFALRWHSMAQARLEQPAQLRFRAAHFDAPEIYGMGCDDWYHSARVRVCAFGNKNAKHNAVAFGDSVALQWFPAYRRLFDKPGWRLLVITKSSCPMVDVPIFYARIGRRYSECEKWRQDAIREIADYHPDVVMMGSTFTYKYTRQQWITGTKRVLDALAPNVGHVYIMRSSPTLPFDGPDCVAPRSWFYSALKGQERCTTPARTSTSNNVFHWLEIAARPFQNVKTVDMTDAICPNDICHAQSGNIITFRDNQHLTATFAASLTNALDHALHLSSTSSRAARPVQGSGSRAHGARGDEANQIQAHP